MATFTPAELTVDRLACRRGGRWVFADVSFALTAGQALLLQGANGSGKSSLLRVLASLIAPADGEVRWNGSNVRDDLDTYRHALRFVSHQDAVKPVLRVRENLVFIAGLAGPPSGIEEALQALGLQALAELPARLLSAGQRRRLALARLAASPAPLWLLDEPGAGLDRPSLQRLHAMIQTHRASGGIVVASSHGDLDLPAAQIFDMSSVRAAA